METRITKILSSVSATYFQVLWLYKVSYNQVAQENVINNKKIFNFLFLTIF